jgi:hypothetical protein
VRSSLRAPPPPRPPRPPPPPQPGTVFQVLRLGL